MQALETRILVVSPPRAGKSGRRGAAVNEISDYAAIVLLVSGGFVPRGSVNEADGESPHPGPGNFLLAAAVVSDAWPALYEHVPILTVERIAVAALVVILFNGGSTLDGTASGGRQGQSSRLVSSARSRPRVH